MVALLTAFAGCSWATNYPDASGPRFAGVVPHPATSPGWPDTLTVVSFNVEHGARLDAALEALEAVERPDLVLLQEMDEEGAARIARALGMGWVYYPAIRNHRTGRHFGNAVLSRWPVISDEKLVLPRLAAFGRTLRTATVATVQVGPREVRVYSAHLGTPVNLSRADRRAQMRTILQDASRHPRVILGGDLNSGSLGEMAVDRGYLWPTEEGPRTLLFGRWDHILLKGLERPKEDAAGTLEDPADASDHRPVWARAIVR